MLLLFSCQGQPQGEDVHYLAADHTIYGVEGDVPAWRVLSQPGSGQLVIGHSVLSTPTEASSSADADWQYGFVPYAAEDGLLAVQCRDSLDTCIHDWSTPEVTTVSFANDSVLPQAVTNLDGALAWVGPVWSDGVAVAAVSERGTEPLVGTAETASDWGTVVLAPILGGSEDLLVVNGTLVDGGVLALFAGPVAAEPLQLEDASVLIAQSDSTPVDAKVSADGSALAIVWESEGDWFSCVHTLPLVTDLRECPLQLTGRVRAGADIDDDGSTEWVLADASAACISGESGFVHLRWPSTDVDPWNGALQSAAFFDADGDDSLDLAAGTAYGGDASQSGSVGIWSGNKIAEALAATR